MLLKGKTSQPRLKTQWPREVEILEAASEAALREEALLNNVAEEEVASKEVVEDLLEPAMPLGIWAAVDVLEA